MLFPLRKNLLLTKFINSYVYHVSTSVIINVPTFPHQFLTAIL